MYGCHGRPCFTRPADGVHLLSADFLQAAAKSRQGPPRPTEGLGGGAGRRRGTGGGRDGKAQQRRRLLGRERHSKQPRCAMGSDWGLEVQEFGENVCAQEPKLLLFFVVVVVFKGTRCRSSLRHHLQKVSVVLGLKKLFDLPVSPAQFLQIFLQRLRVLLGASRQRSRASVHARSHLRQHPAGSNFMLTFPTVF